MITWERHIVIVDKGPWWSTSKDRYIRFVEYSKFMADSLVEAMQLRGYKCIVESYTCEEDFGFNNLDPKPEGK